MTREFKPMLTELGRNKLTAAGLPTDFDAWLALVRKDLQVEYANKRKYARHYTNGAPPKEAIALVSADNMADDMVRDILKRCNEESAKLELNSRIRYGTQYLAERVALQLQQSI
jgi:transcriptional regulator GlxA family with amidase domain